MAAEADEQPKVNLALSTLGAAGRWVLESDSNRYCNTMTLKSMDIVPLRVPQTAARRRDISLTLAM
jgi:hypothetical protein